MMIDEKDLAESFIKRVKDDQKLVVVDGNSIKLYFTPEQKRCYEFDLSEIKTETKLIWWVCHLLNKGWITKDHIRLLIKKSGLKTYG